MALAKLRSELAQRVWSGIVEYANADTREETAESLRRLIEACHDRSRILQPISGYRQFEDVVERTEQGMRATDAFESLAVDYQSDFRNLLAWLSSPTANSYLATEAANFLWRHSRVREEAFEANLDFREKGHSGVERLYRKRISGHQTVLTPVCKYLFDRAERFHDGEFERLRAAFPIRMCDRPGCGKFKLPEKWRKTCYCDNVCRSKANEAKKTPEQKRRYMKRYRDRLKGKIVSKKLSDFYKFS